jgi:SAM-dependent methyltransferase
VNSTEAQSRDYDDLFEKFDSPLMQKIRREAYGRDIGQHSWVTAEELEEDIVRLKLSQASRLFDLGCGPGGPVAFIVGLVGCQATGADISAPALAAGRARTVSQGLDNLITFQQADLNQPLPFADASFDAVMSWDTILHLRNRQAAFKEIKRVLVPGGRFLFTDACVVTGSISNEEVQLRSVYGYIHFAPPGCNEQILESAGFRLIETKDRTVSLLKNAAGRLSARAVHREALEQGEGQLVFDRQQKYLEVVIELSQRKALSRMMYLADSRGESTLAPTWK